MVNNKCFADDCNNSKSPWCAFCYSCIAEMRARLKWSPLSWDKPVDMITNDSK